MENRPDNDRKTLERVNVMLSREVILWLEQTALEIRQKTGASISRSELVRGIVKALAARGLHFDGCRTERDITEGLVEYFEKLARGAVRYTPTQHPLTT